jgi:hypothetical protein
LRDAQLKKLKLLQDQKDREMSEIESKRMREEMERLMEEQRLRQAEIDA